MAAWLDQHPEHRDAWQYVERVGQRFAPLQADGERTLASRTLQGDPRRISRRQGLKSLLVLGAGSLLGWGTWRTTPLPRLVAGWTADFATGTAETRETVLADGSHLWLRAESALDAEFSGEQRLLRLRFGEVLIDTARDATRPFLLQNRHGRLRALGTRFGVRQDPGFTRLSVYQGAVEVRSADSGQLSVIEAGQRIDFDRLSMGTPAPVQRAGESWTRQVLVADDMPLGELVEALARYRHGHLGCNPAVAGLPVMGAFPWAIPTRRCNARRRATHPRAAPHRLVAQRRACLSPAGPAAPTPRKIFSSERFPFSFLVRFNQTTPPSATEHFQGTPCTCSPTRPSASPCAHSRSPSRWPCSASRRCPPRWPGPRPRSRASPSASTTSHRAPGRLAQ